MLVAAAITDATADSGYVGKNSGASVLVAVASQQTDKRTIPTAASAALPNARKVKQIYLPGLDGVKHSLSDWKGRVIVLNFWATWCAPCLAEIRSFVSLQEEYGGRGLQFIGIGLDDPRKLGNVQRTLDINYPILVTDPDVGGHLMAQWGNKSGVVPYTVVVDRQGRVVMRHRGPMHRDEFDEQVLPLLAGEAGK